MEDLQSTALPLGYTANEYNLFIEKWTHLKVISKKRKLIKVLNPFVDGFSLLDYFFLVLDH